MAQKMYLAGRATTTVALTLLTFTAGIFSGWLLWGGGELPGSDETVPDVHLVEPAGAKPAVAATSQDSISEFQRLERRAIQLITDRNFVAALSVLEEADLVARTESELAQLTALLDDTVRRRADQLESMQQLAAIDALYERLTLAMPERPEYYILLAEHRIRMQDPEAALPVLAQIENHRQLGGRARELINEITRVDVAGPLAAVPLVRAGDQFLVEAIVDGTRTVTLLVDTGASTTVLDPDVLTAMGYNLDGRLANFSTAGGVVRAPLIAVAGLSLGGKSVQPLLVGALTLGESNRRVDGLLGMDFLRRFEFSIDQDAAILNLLSLRSP